MTARALAVHAFGAVMLLMAASACGDPTALREPQAEDAMFILSLLDPDTSDQYVQVLTAGASGRIVDPTVQVWEDGVMVASGGPATGALNETVPCTRAYGTMNRPGGDKRCLHLPFRPEHQARYQVVVRANGRPTARALTTIPGPFEIVSADAPGHPPGTDALSAVWTNSNSAESYFVAVHAEEHPPCIGGSCEDLTGGGKNLGWYISVRDTAVTTRVDKSLVEEGEGIWSLDVMALDTAAAQHLTSGTDSDLFPVQPVSNVRGGYGFVGSWVRRSLILETSAGLRRPRRRQRPDPTLYAPHLDEASTTPNISHRRNLRETEGR